jgi:hypothetical protein
LKPRSCGLSAGLDSPGNEGCCHPRPSYRGAMVTANDVVRCVVAVSTAPGNDGNMAQCWAVDSLARHVLQLPGLWWWVC